VAETAIVGIADLSPAAIDVAEDQATAARSTADVPDKETAAVPTAKKRRKGRWVVAAVLAFLIGGGAGFAAQRYFDDRALTDLNGCGRVDRPTAQTLDHVPVSQISAGCEGPTTLPQVPIVV
jgi:hypothetical protein